uniref:Uncharacterized protein n=1 Tax=Setaria italica TaxID=4555 RepID=K3Z785_SETIT
MAARQHRVENPQTQLEVACFAAPVEEDAIRGRARRGAILELHLDQRPVCLADPAGVAEAPYQDVVARVVWPQLPLAHLGDQPPDAVGVPAQRARAHQNAVVRRLGLAVPVLHVEHQLLGVVVQPGVAEPLHHQGVCDGVRGDAPARHLVHEPLRRGQLPFPARRTHQRVERHHRRPHAAGEHFLEHRAGAREPVPVADSLEDDVVGHGVGPDAELRGLREHVPRGVDAAVADEGVEEGVERGVGVRAEGRDGAEDQGRGVRAGRGAEVVDEGGEGGGMQRDAEGPKRGEEREDEREEARAREAVEHACGERVVVEVARRGEERGRGGDWGREGLEMDEERVRFRRGLRLVEKLLRAVATALCRGGGRHRK